MCHNVVYTVVSSQQWQCVKSELIVINTRVSAVFDMLFYFTVFVVNHIVINEVTPLEKHCNIKVDMTRFIVG